MASDVVQAKYDELDTIARRFGQQAQGIGQLRSQVQRSAAPLEAGGWQGRGAQAFFGELNEQVVPATQRLRQALDEARAVTLEIRALLQQAEQEAAAPFRGQAAAGASGAGGGSEAAGGGAAEAAGPSGALIAAGLAADLTPVVGELKGLAEIFTGKDLVTGEELGWWRFAGILGIVGLNEVKLLRHGGKVADAARGLGQAGDASRQARAVSDNAPVLANKSNTPPLRVSREQALQDLRKEAQANDILILADDEAKAYLDWSARSNGVPPENYHAVTLGDTILIREQYADNVRILREEMIHVAQQRAGADATRVVDYEIEAREIMIRNRHAYSLTNDEIREMIREIRIMRDTGRY